MSDPAIEDLRALLRAYRARPIEARMPGWANAAAAGTVMRTFLAVLEEDRHAVSALLDGTLAILERLTCTEHDDCLRDPDLARSCALDKHRRRVADQG